MARGRPPKNLVAPPVNLYGLESLGYNVPLTGDRDTDQISIEMLCFRIGLKPREGGLGKFGHLKNLVDLCWNNPRRPVPKRFVWCEESEKVLRECCKREELGVAGPSSLGKSDPLALWAVVNYIADPTHTKVLIMSTTIGGAKMRIWKTFREYIDTLPDYPGKPLWGTNRLLGPNYDMSGFGDSSGIYLLAGEKGKEKDALDNLIGIKAPMTGDPDTSFEALRTSPEFEDLAEKFDPVELEDLLPRLLNLSAERPGKIIFIIDEATGIVESVYNAIYTNMKPGNPGKIQVIMIGNPNLHWDVFGLFCAPSVGWDNVTLRDKEWETKTGGWCIRFNAEESSLIKGNKKCAWMQSKDEIDDLAERYGKESLYYYRFVLGMWCPEGADFGVYSQGDVEPGMGKVIWGFERPKLHSSLDPSFAAGGDKPSCTFFKYGIDTTGKRVMEVQEQVAIKINAGDKKVPIPYQVVREWKKECIKRGVTPDRAAFDSTGGGLVFAGIVAMEWSAKVQAISSGGKASVRPVGREKDAQGEIIKANQRFANRATEIWYGAHPFLRSGQIAGISNELAKEICSRRHADNRGGDTGRTVQVEDKKTYKKREGSSPDDADSFFVGVEHLRTKYGFKPAEKVGDATPTSADVRAPNSSWEKLKARARRVTVKRNLPRA